ncbi:hypothetical protein UlMin_036829 [Ulmus minor]
MGVGFTVGVFGVLILAHAANSTVQYRGLLKITDEEFSEPPMNVTVELILGSIFCMWVALTIPGKFLSIHPNLGNFLSFIFIMESTDFNPSETPPSSSPFARSFVEDLHQDHSLSSFAKDLRQVPSASTWAW